MSGTSLDGVDAARVEIDASGARLLETHYLPYPDALRAELLALNTRQPDELERAALAGVQLAELYARACAPLLGTPVVAIGCHGQTLRHRPADGYTLQIGNASLLAELTKTTVVADFRSRDIAAGGQGAPLVPAFHAQALTSTNEHRVIVNIGGIANLTDLRPDGTVRGWDTGPGNLLMDSWIARHHQQSHDHDGVWAASGSVHADLLTSLMTHEFFQRALPKSAGREEFNLAALDAALAAHAGIPAIDIQTTLAEFTAASIANAIVTHCPGTQATYVCGGGAHNTHLMTRLAARLPGVRVDSTRVLGVDPDWVEAIAFAWLARQTLLGRPGNLASVTGARGPRILGAIHPA